MKPNLITINPKRVVIILVTIVAFLLFANVAVNLIKLFTDDRSFHGIIPMFELKSEANVPTFFSGCLFLLNAVLLYLVWYVRRDISKLQYIWLFLAVLFVFLAFDEEFEIHELLIEPLRQWLNTSGFFYFAWVIAYGAAAVALGVLFFPVWWKLESNIKWWFAASAVVYLLGAIGLEMAGGAYYEAVSGEGGILYAAMYTTEETLEMLGLVILTYTLLRLLSQNSGDLTILLPGSAKASADMS